MLLGALDLLFNDPLDFFRLVPPMLVAVGLSLLLAITVHEFSHALVANALGDTTAKRLGRLTLNPMAHLDPMGSAMILMVGFGWGKPVPVNPRFLRGGERSGMAIVSSAGPISNIATAMLLSIPIRAGLVQWREPFRSSLFQGGVEGIIGDLLGFMIFFNVLLAVFNLIPIAPLDGFKVAWGVMPREMAMSWAKLEPYGPAILLSVIMLDYIARTGILFGVIRPVANTLGLIIVGEEFF